MMILRIILYVLVFVFFSVTTYVFYNQNRLQGKPLREQANLWLNLSIVFAAVLIVCLLARDGPAGLLMTMLVGAVLIAPLCWWSKWWIGKHIHGNRFRYGRGDRLSCALSSSLIFTLFFLALDLTGDGEGFSKILSIFTGFALASIVAHAYIRHRVIELETELGESIVQEVR